MRGATSISDHNTSAHRKKEDTHPSRAFSLDPHGAAIPHLLMIPKGEKASLSNAELTNSLRDEQHEG
jgi:hypothetical protein